MESPSGPLIPGGLRLVASDGAPDGAPSFATLQDRPLRSTSSDLPGLLRTLEVLVPFYASCRATDGRGNPAEVMRRFYSRNRSDRIHGIILRQVSEHLHPQFSEASRVGFLT